eukprot:GHVH01010747.1.p1 GENE.GHVH01010747.1~~GHVH01010747.1.p1  ORF type:complete len:146 (-),score=19.72 GHVH01010747.1:45-482(-)
MVRRVQKSGNDVPVEVKKPDIIVEDKPSSSNVEILSVRAALSKATEVFVGKISNPTFHDDEVGRIFLFIRSVWSMFAGVVAGFTPYVGRYVFIAFGGLSYLFFNAVCDRLKLTDDQKRVSLQGSVMPCLIGFTFSWVLTNTILRA